MKKTINLLYVFLAAFFSLLLNNLQAAENVPTEAPTVAAAEESLTPFQYLNLITANSESLSFSYKVIKDGQEDDLGTIARSGESTVAVFHATKMDGSKVKIRLIETGELVFYVIDSEKKVFAFKSPTDDILLHKMQEIVREVPEKVFKKDEGVVYAYQQPFLHDEAIKLTWQFYMQNDRLIKLEYLFDGKLDTVYEFSEFTQEEPVADLLLIPEGYTKESFSYSYTGDTMPPWFE